MAKPRKALEPWQAQDAERLKRLWDEKRPKSQKPNLTARPMSQEEFGELFGIGNQAAVYQYLDGRIPLNPEAAAKFAAGLKVEVQDFSPRLAEHIASLAQVAAPITSTSDGRILVPVTSREELCLEFFKKLTPQQQEDVIKDLRVMADGNRVVEKVAGRPLKKHVGNAEMEGKYGFPKKPEKDGANK